jgi:hypothetical protein
MTIRRIFSLAAAAGATLCACFVLRCAHDDNPFSDPSNARAVVSHVSFSDKDTVNIFTTETLQTMIAVRDLVDSVTIIAAGNRRGPDTVVARHPSAAGPNTSLISFSDTGWTSVSISTFRKNGDGISTRYSLYCRSPLSQPGVSGDYGAPVALAASGVGDHDVLYHWDFGNNVVVTSPAPDTSAVVKYAAYDTTGSLWVSDPDGKHPSPKVPFSCNLKDETGPKIVCVNPSYSNKDTILTGDTTLYLRFRISDPAQTLPVFSTQVNGDTFRIKEDPYYIQIFGHMDTAVRFIPVVVSAIDNPRFRNMSRDTFYIRFSDSLSHSNGVVITVLDPSTDSSVSQAKDDKLIIGNIEDYSHDSIAAVVRMWLNGKSVLPPDTVRDKRSARWSFRCGLSDGTNRISLAAYSFGGDTLATKSITIEYNPAIKDTTPPVILEIAANGKNGTIFYTPNDSAFLRIIAFDEGSGMKDLLINGVAIAPARDGYGFIWYDTVVCEHRAGGTTLSVIAVDKEANTATTAVTVFKNTAPVITHTPSFPDKVYVGSAYSDYLLSNDKDKDPVIVTKLSGPSSISVSETGRIDWKPLAADTGSQTVTFSLFDGYESVEFSFRAMVLGDTTNLPPQVRFATVPKDFPAYLEVNRDSLKMTLKTYNESGNAPLAFSAVLQSSSARTVAIDMPDSVLSWRPAISDTGPGTLVLTVADRFKRTDTLRAAIAVVPPNRPCSLYVSSTIPTFNNGELNMSGATMPETLFFFVRDPDPAIAEQLTARIRWPLSESVMGIDSSRRFILILNPKTPGTKSKDTVQVLVKDKAQHADSLTFFISYVNQTVPVSNSRTLVVNTSSAGARITGNVLDFPLLVRLDKSFFPFDSVVQGGRDVRFRKSDGTPRPYEIESWDSAAGTAAIWVLMDTVFADNATQNLQMTWRSTTDRGGSDGHAVFDTAKGFQGVWHMSDATPGQNMNSAQNAFHAAPSTVNNPVPQSNGGMIAQADSIPANNYLVLGNLPTPQNVTISAWVYPVRVATNGKIVCKPWTNYNNPYQIYSLEANGAAAQSVRFHVGLSPASTAYATGNNMMPQNAWTYLAGTYDGTSIRLYVNGAMTDETQFNNQPGPKVPANNQPWTIGSWGLAAGESFCGKVDEVRICRGALGADFIKLSFENQRPGNTMVTFK